MKIFVASTGRCGTKFMTWVFRNYTNVPSFHEPYPKLTGKESEEINAGRISPETRQEITKKFDFIEAQSKAGFYFESSNMFIKSFWKLAMERWPEDVGIIYIRRDLANYLISFTRRGKRGKKGRFHSVFLLRPEAEGNLMPGPEGMSFYETVAWNYYEVMARYLKARETAVRFFEMEFSEINNIQTWRNLFRTFGIEHTLPNNFPETPDRHQSIFDTKTKLLCLEHLKQNWPEPRTIVDSETMAQLKGDQDEL